MNWFAYPVDSWVVSDDNVRRIDKDYFIIFISGILVDPVRIENTKIATHPSNSFFSNAS
jgi:hypothetical protein